MSEIKSGPLTVAELQAIWAGAVDKGYREPFIVAGDGRGFEVWTQLFAQLARASTAIDVTTQAMYISPWSGQTNPPAAGESYARTNVLFSRTKLPTLPLRLQAGTVLVEEVTTDAGENGGVTVHTGRRYVTTADVVFEVGEQGPIEVEVLAEKAGYGYNNPLPGSLSFIPQVGSGFANDHAKVTVTTQPAILNGSAMVVKITSDNQPDMFVPGHVGQMLLFTAGLNAGKVARIKNFTAPNTTSVPPVGSAVELELLWSVQVDSLVGSFTEGETIAFGSPATGYATCVAFDATSKRMAFVMVNGSAPVVTTALTGVQSGATAAIEVVLASSSFVAESPTVAGVGGASWRILDWVDDWNLTVTNPESPRGGIAGFLDELGSERAIYRSPGENDESYRARVREIADVVSPNAIRRALNRSLDGLPWCLREVGLSGMRGLFMDGTGEAPSTSAGRDRCDAFDYDTLTLTGLRTGTFVENEKIVIEDVAFARCVEGYYGRTDFYNFLATGIITVIRKRGRLPNSLAGLRVRGLQSGATFTIDEEIENRAIGPRRFRTLLSYEDFRSYFLVGLPRITAGDFGMAYDVGPHDAFDAAPFQAGYDGYATAAPPVWLRTYRAVDAARAGGVGFDVYQEFSGCTTDEPNGEPLYLIDPASMPGLVALWDETGIHDDGSGRVDLWTDASGNGNDWVQSVGANRPEFLDVGASTIAPRRKGLNFPTTGGHWMELAAPITSTTGWTLIFFGAPGIFVFGATVPNNVPNTVFGDSVAGTAAFGVGSFFGDCIEYTNNSSFPITTNVSTIPVGEGKRPLFDGRAHMCGVRHFPFPGSAGFALTGDTAEVNFDGLRETSLGITWNAAAIDRLGVGFGGTDPFLGELYAAMIFNRPLTAKELRLLFFRFQVMYF